MSMFVDRWVQHAALFPDNEESTLAKAFTDLMPVKGVRQYLQSEQPPTLQQASQIALLRATRIQEAREITRDLRASNDGFTKKAWAPNTEQRWWL